MAVEFSKTVKVTAVLENGTEMDAARLLDDFFIAVATRAETMHHPQYGNVRFRVETP